MKSVKITPPEGYEIDKDKSSFEEIVFKKIEKKLITSWEDLGRISGIYIHTTSVLRTVEENTTYDSRNIYPTKQQAEAGLLLPQLLQVRDYLRDDWTPSKDKECYCVIPDGEQLVPYRLTKDNFNIMYGWLTFPTKELCEHFIQYFGGQVIELTTKLA